MVLAGSFSPAEGADGTDKLLVLLRGNTIGSEDSTVRRTPEGLTIAGTGRLAPPLDLTTRRLLVRYDAQWKPIELQVDAVSRGSVLTVRTTFAGGTASNEVTQLGQTSRKDDPVAADTVVLPNLFFSTYEALSMRLVTIGEGDTTMRAYIAPQAEIGVKVKRLGTQAIETPKRTVDAQRFALTFMNPGNALEAEVWADADGRLVRFEVPAQGLLVVREDVAAVSARRQNITRAGDEPARFPSVGFTIAGTVSRPAGSGDAKGRFPAVVLVPGSGSVDRDETVAGIPIFGQIAGGLADAGFLVLRYDKRGVGQTGGRTEAATLPDLADDALAAVKFLRKREDVDEDRIAILGHSEGAWVALVAASRESDIAAVVLAAAPSGTGGDLVLEQQAHLLSKMNLQEQDKRARQELQVRIQAAVAGKGSWDNVPEELKRQADTPWFRSFLGFSPAGIVSKLRQPILIVQGELDTQVAPHHADRLAELARGRKKAAGAVTAVKVPGVNHLLVPAKTGELDEYQSLSSSAVSPAVTGPIVEWLKARLPARN